MLSVFITPINTKDTSGKFADTTNFSIQNNICFQEKGMLPRMLRTDMPFYINYKA